VDPADNPQPQLLTQPPYPPRSRASACTHAHTRSCAGTPFILCNRGASGIDGILHTALGAALGSSEPCTVLIGDLALLHDLNALATLSKAVVPIVVVILNNHGGEIFRFLPIARFTDVFSPYFDTPHSHSFEQCCTGFGLPYNRVGTREQFVLILEKARQFGGCSVIEVATHPDHACAEVVSLRSLGQDVARRCALRYFS